jgi:hypothetical protein
MSEKTIHMKAIEAGVEVDHHSLDLYLPVNDITRKLVAEYKHPMSVTTFTCQITGQRMFEVPFAFDGFWTDAEKQVEQWAKALS